ncbi:ATP-dependent bile acid permease [Fusarium albosuccineum]|uniref:ATP-dependent bile acid permease n=1 Tax=Fusarium albosuccineum TaxID=1237068 RepID=A0A8H4LMC7_9HYPO|nr:ATP-dependent bile acid permease [Fusarium albosuccineum]
MSQTLSVALSSVALTIAALSAFVALLAVFGQLRSGKPKDRFYEDVDGIATPESLAKFSNKGAKTGILLSSACGAGTSIGSLVLLSLSKVKNESILKSGLQVAAWGFVLIHATCIAIHHSLVKSHNLGIWLALSAFFLATSSVSQLMAIGIHVNQHKDPVSILYMISTISAVGLAVTSITLPRRPNVFFNNSKVDCQWTVSALNRYTWTWVQPLFRHALIHNDIGVEDVPQADAKLRSEHLTKDWDKLRSHQSLFRSILSVHRGKLALLWTVTLVRCAVSILPFWFMFRILNILQDRTAASHSVQLLALILCMAISNLIDSWMEGWAYWYSLSDVALPIRTQISGLIFDKALRRKNIKSASQDGHSSDSEESTTSDEDSGVLKSHQAIVNLVGIDTERLFYFFQFHFMILNGVIKLVIFSAFLLQLLGWIPFVAGIAAWALTLPPNTWFSGKVLAESRSLMGLRDAKLSKINEVLVGMRQIKFSALESQWEQRILALRETELKTLWKFFLADSGLFACWVISPILLAVASLTAYVLLHGSLLPSVAFVSIGVFNNLETTLGSLPELFTLGLDSLVSVRRINTYLSEPERKGIITNASDISFEGASISWPAEERTPYQDRFILHGLYLSFPQGGLSVISGRIGTGKSLLLSAILGEADLLDGSIYAPKGQSAQHNDADPNNWIIPGSIAYVSDSPWLENTSLRNNILFGLPFVKPRYDQVIQVCALEEDLDALPDRDGTELGANGVNLSGGQKWRITLARAVYSQVETLVMEDIFSAVDARVGAWIFEKCLAGDICKGRTRIIATHHVSLVLPEASFVVELGYGTVTYSGPPRDQVDQCSSPSAGEVTDSQTDEFELLMNAPPVKQVVPLEVSSEAPAKFMQEEIRQKGTVKGGVYLTYIGSSGGLPWWAICIGVYVAYQAGIIGRAWWLRIWTSQTSPDASHGSLHDSAMNTLILSTQPSLVQVSGQTAPNNDTLFYLRFYIIISMGTAAVGILRNMTSYYLAVRASRAIFKKMLFSVMRVPLRWLDTVPTGRILNRFTADFNIIDERIAMTWSLFFSNLLRMVGICVASCFASAYLIPPAIVLLGLGMVTGARYLAASRPLKRLESNAKSPVFELFNTTLRGISTIRAFRKAQTYIAQMHSNLDTWTMTTFYIALANRWMSFRMALIAALFSIAVGVVIITSPIDAALAGLALSFVLDFSESLRWTIRCYGDMELEMNSMERVVEYMTLKTEPLSGERPSAAWPTSGTLELKNLEVGYAPTLPPVLKGLSFKINHNERIGVVGRTGAGKSSLTLALFRFLEARSGSIIIDGIDISKIRLSDLRSRLSIIPQSPILFSGTVRSNLDPFGQHTDAELYECLAKVHLINTDLDQPDAFSTINSTNMFLDLSSPISESGGNLSQGQQQLLCIARALLANSKIIVLDEATSAIDVATDTLIQRSIREWFTDRTLIVIAHRLSTVADFDRILVLDDGQVVEFGTPRELWYKGGAFRSMCESTSTSEKERLRQSIID